MFSFRRMQKEAPTESDKERVKREGHEISKKLLEYYCSNIGFLPQDVQPHLKDYRASRKVWEGMSMGTIYTKFNDPKILPIIIWLDCRMRDEEMAKIDEMDLVTVDALHKEGKQGSAHRIRTCLTLQGQSRAPIPERESQVLPSSVGRRDRCQGQLHRHGSVTGATCAQSRGALEHGAN